MTEPGIPPEDAGAKGDADGKALANLEKAAPKTAEAANFVRYERELSTRASGTTRRFAAD